MFCYCYYICLESSSSNELIIIRYLGGEDPSSSKILNLSIALPAADGFCGYHMGCWIHTGPQFRFLAFKRMSSSNVVFSDIFVSKVCILVFARLVIAFQSDCLFLLLISWNHRFFLGCECYPVPRNVLRAAGRERFW